MDDGAVVESDDDVGVRRVGRHREPTGGLRHVARRVDVEDVVTRSEIGQHEAAVGVRTRRRRTTRDLPGAAEPLLAIGLLPLLLRTPFGDARVECRLLLRVLVLAIAATVAAAVAAPLRGIESATDAPRANAVGRHRIAGQTVDDRAGERGALLDRQLKLLRRVRLDRIDVEVDVVGVGHRHAKLGGRDHVEVELAVLVGVYGLPVAHHLPEHRTEVVGVLVGGARLEIVACLAGGPRRHFRIGDRGTVAIDDPSVDLRAGRELDVPDVEHLARLGLEVALLTGHVAPCFGANEHATGGNVVEREEPVAVGLHRPAEQCGRVVVRSGVHHLADEGDEGIAAPLAAATAVSPAAVATTTRTEVERRERLQPDVGTRNGVAVRADDATTDGRAAVEDHVVEFHAPAVVERPVLTHQLRCEVRVGHRELEDRGRERVAVQRVRAVRVGRRGLRCGLRAHHVPHVAEPTGAADRTRLEERARVAPREERDTGAGDRCAGRVHDPAGDGQGGTRLVVATGSTGARIGLAWDRRASGLLGGGEVTLRDVHRSGRSVGGVGHPRLAEQIRSGRVATPQEHPDPRQDSSSGHEKQDRAVLHGQRVRALGRSGSGAAPRRERPARLRNLSRIVSSPGRTLRRWSVRPGPGSR